MVPRRAWVASPRVDAGETGPAGKRVVPLRRHCAGRRERLRTRSDSAQARPSSRGCATGLRALKAPGVLSRGPSAQRRCAPIQRPDGVRHGPRLPLTAYSQRQAEGVRQRLARRGVRAEWALAVRYGNSSIRAGIDQTRAADCERILVVPCWYPQYAATTTATVVDAVTR